MRVALRDFFWGFIMEKIIYKSGCIISKKYKPGMEFCFQLSIPTKKVEKYALLIEHDGLNEANVQSMLRLAEESNAPYCICVGVLPAKQVLANGEKYDRRINSYDLFNNEYADFIVLELLPYIEKEYDIKFDENPDLHYISGGSSGGISAFVIAWFHSEYFHRVYMSSPSFLSMGRGNELPYLIRKYETKPIKIYEEYSENEPNDYFGASFPIDVETRMALEFAGYDFSYEYFPNEGHCSRYGDYETAYKRNKWIWESYREQTIVAPRNSPRIDIFISLDSKWEKTDCYPNKERIETELSKKYDKIIPSADKQLLYVSNIAEDVVYSMVNKKGIQAEEHNVHAMLHTIPGINPKGTLDMDIDVNDRLYVLTAIGIQCIRSFGLIDAILNLPEGKPLEICVTDYIFVKTDKGIYKRKLRPEYLKEKKRLFTSYYD